MNTTPTPLPLLISTYPHHPPPLTNLCLLSLRITPPPLLFPIPTSHTPLPSSLPHNPPLLPIPTPTTLLPLPISTNPHRYLFYLFLLTPMTLLPLPTPIPTTLPLHILLTPTALLPLLMHTTSTSLPYLSLLPSLPLLMLISF